MQRQTRFLRLPGSRIALRTAPEPVGRADRRLGRRRGAAVEIPTKEEIHDNIVAFWRPKNPLQAKGEHTYTYRLHWGPDVPKATSLARFRERARRARGDGIRLFVLDLDRRQAQSQSIRRRSVAVVSADKAKVQNIVTQPNPETGGWRLSFDLADKDAPVEMRAHR